MSAVALFAAIAAFLTFTVWAFHHDHSRGHCGWSGCERPTRSTQ